ncbi:MAG: hypothetical protein WAT65_09195, partial [Candidatus Nanopelagicales bacterium]
GKQLRSQAAKVAAQQSRVNAVTARNRREYRAWVNETGQSGTSYDEWRADTSTNGVTEAQLSRLEKSLNDSVTQLNKLSAQQNVALQRYVGNGARQTIENPDGKHYLALQQTGCLK